MSATATNPTIRTRTRIAMKRSLAKLSWALWIPTADSTKMTSKISWNVKSKYFYAYLEMWMVYSLVVRARGPEYGGLELESRCLHLKPETKLREERGLSGFLKGLKTVPLAQALLSLKPTKTNNTSWDFYIILTPIKGFTAFSMPMFTDAVWIWNRKKIISHPALHLLSVSVSAWRKFQGGYVTCCW